MKDQQAPDDELSPTLTTWGTHNNASKYGAGLPDLGIYPKIFGIFESDGIFLEIYFPKRFGINLGNFMNWSGKLLLICLSYFKASFVFASIVYSNFKLFQNHKIGV